MFKNMIVKLETRENTKNYITITVQNGVPLFEDTADFVGFPRTVL